MSLLCECGNPGTICMAGGRRGRQKAATFTRRYISNLVRQLCFTYTFSHWKKEVIHSPIPVVKIASRFIPCPCAKHTPDTNPIVAHPYTFTGTRAPTCGGIPSVALNNSWKWLVMLYLEQNEIWMWKDHRKSHKCWDSRNRKHLSGEEAQPSLTLSHGARGCGPKPWFSAEGWQHVTPPDFLFSHAYHPRILNVHDYLYRAMHTPYYLYRTIVPNGNRNTAENKKAQGRYFGASRIKSLFSMGSGYGVWLWWHIWAGGSWGFQVGFKEMGSTMNASSVFRRQWERWFIWNP